MSARLQRILSLLLPVVLFAGWALESEPRVFLVGDSTMADKPLTGNPERGWGQFLPALFKNGLTIENHARNGRSTKSFIAEGRWVAVVKKLQPGDFVLIQFGHNDAKKEDSTRYADANTAYKANLVTFINDARSRQAIPILITPVCRRRFDSKGKFVDVHGDYPAAVREVGERLSVPVIDLHKWSKDLFDRYGVESTKQLFLWADSGKYSSLPKGKRDDTHFVSRGAREVAKMVADEIRRLDLPLKEFLKIDGLSDTVGEGKLVMLDCFYNNEWKKDKSGTPFRFHYIWDDTTNSGFSKLASIITGTGADIDTLCQAPSPAELRRADIYIIVDPDTDKETENPNYIDSNAISAMFEWVTEGGVLVLLGNDKGNTEFEHFNQLAERFGIHFNEDSRNPATSTEFQSATFDRFPEHPVFNNVRKVFMKELSTLRIQEPARAIISDKDDVIIAFAKVGKGGVLAVGDPWFYNEYMGTWRLPEGYDNPKTADNLIRWLLTGSFKH